MTVTLPPLRERTHKERFALLQLFFTNEAIRLRKDIHVSPNAMRAFVFYNCPNNIGQLKQMFKLHVRKPILIWSQRNVILSMFQVQIYLGI